MAECHFSDADDGHGEVTGVRPLLTVTPACTPLTMDDRFGGRHFEKLTEYNVPLADFNLPTDVLL